MTLKSLWMLIIIIFMSGFLPGCKPIEPCRDPMGCVELASGENLTIGAAVPLTGANRASGEAALAAIQETAAQKVKIDDHTLRIQKVDFDCRNDNAVVVAERLTGEASLAGVIAPACLLSPSSARDVFSQAGVTVLAPSSGQSPSTLPPGILDLHPSNGSWEGAIDPKFATQAARTFFSAIEATATLRPDGVLVVPRQTLQNKLLDMLQSGDS